MKRGLYKTEAVILNSCDFGESDRVLAFYTLGHGKIKGIAKGARRSRKRFVGNLDALSHITLIFFRSEKSELVRVEDATLIEGFQGLKTDIERLSQACYLLELVSEMTREGLVMPRLFEVLLYFIRMLDAGEDPCVVTRFFEIKLLSILGYLPYLEGCVVCKEELQGGAKLSFSSEKGGAVCAACSAGLGGLINMTAGTAKFLGAAEKLEGDKLTRLRPSTVFLEESERLLDDFIRHQVGKELKTKRFLSKLRNAAFEARR